jgi:L-cysteine desulfidase
MKENDRRYRAYLSILEEELIPAMGCTEPIAIAYASAKARQVLGKEPDRVLIEASDNIVKNVKSVVVPNTGNLKGIKAAAAAGIVAGDADKVLEVISDVGPTAQDSIRQFLERTDMRVLKSGSPLTFNLLVKVFHKNLKASVQVSHFHTNIVLVTKDDQLVYQNRDCDGTEIKSQTDRSFMNVKDILEFAQSVDIQAVKNILERQINYNSKIAAEGMKSTWGVNIGRLLMETWNEDIKVRAKAMAAAGADARMSGCDLPVVIVSGSGNQGLTASIPVIEYARAMNVEKEALYRALLVSNLVTIHQKTGIGRLSAYCGAVSAGTGAGAGISLLHGGGYRDISHTIVNALAILSGMICDGAKPSCAAKIAFAVEAGILGFDMYRNKKQFYDGEGIVKKGVENTIASIGKLSREGMRETDREIIRIMLEE